MHETTHLSYEEGTVNITLNSESLYEIAPPAFRFTDYENLVQASFNKKELDAISEGAAADLNYTLTISEDIENEELKSQFLKARQKEENDLGLMQEAMYIDLSAAKSMPGDAEQSITNLSEDVYLVIDVPLYLISEDRTYWIMINNMGECVLLPDLDQEPNTITVSAHTLTTGVLLYQDPLDSLNESQSQGFVLRGRHLLYAGIVLLVLLWVIISHLHKNDM